MCLKSSILCLGCEHKVKEGKISQLDVKISRILFDLAKNDRGIASINFKRSIEADDLIVILVGKGEISNVVGKGGRVIHRLEEALNSKIRVIEEGADIRKQVQDVLTPAKVDRKSVV